MQRNLMMQNSECVVAARKKTSEPIRIVQPCIAIRGCATCTCPHSSCKHTRACARTHTHTNTYNSSCTDEVYGADLTSDPGIDNFPFPAPLQPPYVIQKWREFAMLWMVGQYIHKMDEPSCVQVWMDTIGTSKWARTASVYGDLGICAAQYVKS